MTDDPPFVDCSSFTAAKLNRMAEGFYSPQDVARLVGLYRMATTERDEARDKLNRCWDAAGLLCAEWTGQPDQAWEKAQDLIEQIYELASHADNAEEAEEERGGAIRERDSLRNSSGKVTRELLQAMGFTKTPNPDHEEWVYAHHSIGVVFFVHFGRPKEYRTTGCECDAGRVALGEFFRQFHEELISDTILAAVDKALRGND